MAVIHDTLAVTVETIVEEIEILHLRPGDRLAVRLPDDPGDLDNDRARGLVNILTERWPEFAPLVFVGDMELTVIRKEV